MTQLFRRLVLRMLVRRQRLLSFILPDSCDRYMSHEWLVDGNAPRG